MNLAFQLKLCTELARNFKKNIKFCSVIINVNHRYCNEKEVIRIRNTVLYIKPIYFTRNIVFQRFSVNKQRLGKISLWFPVLI